MASFCAFNLHKPKTLLKYAVEYRDISFNLWKISAQARLRESAEEKWQQQKKIFTETRKEKR